MVAMGKETRLTGLILIAALASAGVTASAPNAYAATNNPGDATVSWQAITSQIAASNAQDSRIEAAIATWRTLEKSSNLSFSTYAAFLLQNPGWPSESVFRARAEKAVSLETDSPSQIDAFFARFPARTAQARAIHALALLRLGRLQDARQVARQAWVAGPMDSTTEQRLLASFAPSLTAKDHLARADILLWNRNPTAAERLLAYVPATRQAVITARIALQRRSSDAASDMRAADPVGARDAGYLADKAGWLTATGQPDAAWQLLAQRQPLAELPNDPEHWFEALYAQARAAAKADQWALAYAIASKVDDAFAPGTDVSTRSFGVRDEYTNLTWLAGTAALHHLGRPAEAEGMFMRYAGGAQSPQTITKGLYWAGRAALQAGHQPNAQAHFRAAGAYPDQFYGQLALERLGEPIPRPGAERPIVQLSAVERTDFKQQPIVRAAELLGRQGDWTDQTKFIRAIASQARTEADHVLAAQLARTLGRPDLGVMVGQRATASGLDGYSAASFPRMALPADEKANWTMIHAISRQESQFDREITSYAGARGLMQLMPATAREVAQKNGLTYNRAELFDPDYNVTLGSAFFQYLMNYYDGSYPLAIAAYNAGMGNVNKWLRANGDPRTPGVDIVEWIEEIPIYQTKNYVQRVLENAVVYDQLNPSKQDSMAASTAPLSRYLGKKQPG